MVDFTSQGRMAHESWNQPRRVRLQLSALNKLVDDWHAGDAAAGEEMYHRFLPSVHSVVNNHLNRRFQVRFDADDMTQTIFLKLLQQLRVKRYYFSGDAGLAGWVRHFARNVVIKRIKFELAKKRSPDREERLSESSSQGDRLAAGNPLNDLRDILPVVEQLDPVCCRIVSMLLDGRMQAEIARDLGISTRSVRRKIALIRNAIQAARKAAA